jgi:hypothetical protein
MTTTPAQARFRVFSLTRAYLLLTRQGNNHQSDFKIAEKLTKTLVERIEPADGNRNPGGEKPGFPGGTIKVGKSIISSI